MEKIFSERQYSHKRIIAPSSSISQEFNNIININCTSRYKIYLFSVLPPPNPLPQRKNIPVHSPKFGKNVNYM